MRRRRYTVIFFTPILLFGSTFCLFCSPSPDIPGPMPSRYPVAKQELLAEGHVDLGIVLMESTCKLQGTTAEDSLLFGTAFLFHLPCGGDAERAVLVTSAHLLDSLAADRAVLGLRDRRWDGTWEERPWWIQIRSNSKPLWIRHKEADVAALCTTLPRYAEVPLSALELLADAETFQRYEIHPGDELLCLGYSSQNGVHGRGGFAILRGGRIASYPLYPVEKYATFRYDVEIFRGYSGGPVYFSQVGRIYGGVSHPQERIQFIAGLLTRQWFADKEEKHPLKVAEVVHAHFIREILEKLLTEELDRKNTE
jgi:hypothetical protein